MNFYMVPRVLCTGVGGLIKYLIKLRLLFIRVRAVVEIKKKKNRQQIVFSRYVYYSRVPVRGVFVRCNIINIRLNACVRYE